MVYFADFSEECSTIAFFQRYFSDHYILRYKLPLQWKRQGRLKIIERSQGLLWEVLPLLVLSGGFILSSMAVIELNYFDWSANQDLNGGSAHWLKSMTAYGCGIFSFGCAGSYLNLCIVYRNDIQLGLNLLIMLYKQMEQEETSIMTGMLFCLTTFF